MGDLTAADAARLLDAATPGQWSATTGTLVEVGGDYPAGGDWLALVSDAGASDDMAIMTAAPDLARAVMRIEAERDEALAERLP